MVDLMANTQADAFVGDRSGYFAGYVLRLSYKARMPEEGSTGRHQRMRAKAAE